MRKPPGIVYGADEASSRAVAVLTAIQHVGVISIFLIYPVLISREVGGSPRIASDLVSIALLVLGIGSALQALKHGPVGAGILCAPVPSAIYLVPSLLAVRKGGLPLLFGMTAFAGLIEIALSRVLRFLRPLFPPEIAGLVILLIGVTTGAVGIRTLIGVGDPVSPGLVHAIVAAVTLGTMVALNVWTRGGLRLFCVLIGMAIGYALAEILGAVGAAQGETFAAVSWIALPRFDHVSWAFDASLALTFAVTAVAASLKAAGNITTFQKLNDADWIRADMQSISRGVLADGIATTLAGALGTVGVNSGSNAVGIANATGVLSRKIGYVITVLLISLAFFPKLGILLYLMPKAVSGAALFFVATFIFINGLEIMTSRLLDARRTLVIGLSFLAGIAVDFFPGFFGKLPETALALFGSSLVLGTLTAFSLNLLFRIGVRKTQKLAVDAARVDSLAIESFMEAQGAAWGARRDIIDRASFDLTQSIETIVESCEPQGPLEIEASFDEFSLDVRVSYSGPPLELPEKRPTNEEIVDSEEGQRRLAGFMLRRHADRVAATHRGGRSTILFHFDH